MKYRVVRKHNNSDMCVVCGTGNGFSLGTRYYELENGWMVGLVTGRDEHQSYPGRMHGGLITALLDETIGRAVNVPEPDGFAVTSEIQVKFKKPVPLGEELKVVSRLTRNTRLMFQAEGFIEDAAGNLCATGSATYVKMSPQRITGSDAGLTEKQWFLLPDNVSEIEIANGAWFDHA